MNSVNEVKKRLYREKPTAFRTGITSAKNETWLYEAHMKGLSVKFKVPVSDMGENVFEKQLPAQLLIRWLDLKDDD